MSPLPRIGSQIGNYQLIDFIDAGGMGAVYLAQHLYLDRQVAFKVLSEDLSGDDDFRRRFLRESRLAEKLSDHPHVVRVYDAGEADGVLYMAMRYVGGTDLRQILKAESRLAVDRTLSIVSQVGSALDAAHAIGLIHRDVKPANILIDTTPDGSDYCFLADFGLVRDIHAGTRLTRTGFFVGTPDYMAPEQIEPERLGEEPLDGRVDVYSLGCVLFECLAGKAPYAGDRAMQAAILAHLSNSPPRVTEVCPDLPREIDDVMAKALAKARDQRYPTAGALAEAAATALAPVVQEASERPHPATDPSTAPTRLAPPPQAVSVPPTVPVGREGTPFAGRVGIEALGQGSPLQALARQRGIANRLSPYMARLEPATPLHEALLDLALGTSAVRGRQERVLLALTDANLRAIALQDGVVLEVVDRGSPLEATSGWGPAGGDLEVTQGGRSIFVWAIRPSRAARRVADELKRRHGP